MEKSMRAKQWLDRAVYLASAGLSGAIRTFRSANPVEIRSIVCFKEDEIGDFMYSIPVYEMLSRSLPEAHITVLCKGFGVQLLKGNPYVHRTITSYSELEPHYDLVVDLRGTPASTWFALTHVPRLRLDRGSVRIRQRRSGRHPHESDTAWEIVRPLVSEDKKVTQPQLYLDVADHAEAENFIRQEQLDSFLLIHTGARRKLKKWPLERAAKLLSLLHQRYGLEPVLVGDQYDATDAEELIRAGCPTLRVAAGKLSLRGFAALCSRSQLFIGNDSGPLHIASAVGTRSIGLFGPGDPIFHPVGAHTRYVHHVLECNPCDQVHCKYAGNPCIERITIGEVETAAKNLLGNETLQG
ncbi:MAG: glycosyltransferase family 9 protein [Bacteroidota bacterium]|jgi:ADP-heptose:LPS heptosyltransferase